MSIPLKKVKRSLNLKPSEKIPLGSENSGYTPLELWQEHLEVFTSLTSIVSDVDHLNPNKKQLEKLQHTRSDLRPLIDSLLFPGQCLDFSVSLSDHPRDGLQMMAKPLRLLIEQVSSYIQQLDPDSKTDQEIKHTLQDILNHYEEFQTNLDQISFESLCIARETPTNLTLPNGNAYLINQAQARHLVQRRKNGEPEKRTNTYGLHQVLNMRSQRLHVKNQPLCIHHPNQSEPTLIEHPSAIIPWMETAINILIKRIAGYGAAPTLLAKLHGVKFTPSQGKDEYHDFILQASRTVEGVPLLDLLIEPKYRSLLPKIQDESFSFSFFFATIFHFQDGKPDNLMMQCYTSEGSLIEDIDLARDLDKIHSLKIIHIDNEPAFAPPIVKAGKMYLPGTRTILFLLNDHLNKTMNDKVKNVILNLRFEELILEWLSILYQSDLEYYRLRDQGFLTQYDYNQLRLPIRFVPDTQEIFGTVNKLYHELKKWHQILKEKPNMTHLEILYEFDPIFANHYQQVLKKTNGDPLESMAVIYGGYYQGQPVSIEQTILSYSVPSQSSSPSPPSPLSPSYSSLSPSSSSLSSSSSPSLPSLQPSTPTLLSSSSSSVPISTSDLCPDDPPSKLSSSSSSPSPTLSSKKKYVSRSASPSPERSTSPPLQKSTGPSISVSPSRIRSTSIATRPTSPLPPSRPNRKSSNMTNSGEQLLPENITNSLSISSNGAIPSWLPVSSQLNSQQNSLPTTLSLPTPSTLSYRPTTPSRNKGSRLLAENNHRFQSIFPSNDSHLIDEWQKQQPLVVSDRYHETSFTQPIVESIEVFLKNLDFSLVSHETEECIWQLIQSRDFPPLTTLCIKNSRVSDDNLFTLISKQSSLLELAVVGCNQLTVEGFLASIVRWQSIVGERVHIKLRECQFLTEPGIKMLYENSKKYRYSLFIETLVEDHPVLTLTGRDKRELVCDLLYCGYFEFAEHILKSEQINMNITFLKKKDTSGTFESILHWHLFLQRPNQSLVRKALEFLVSGSYLDLTIQGSNGWTAAHYAATQDPNDYFSSSSSFSSEQPLPSPSSSSTHKKKSTLEFLLKENRQLSTSVNKMNETPLHLAVQNKCFINCFSLISFGSSITSIDSHKRTPVHYAAINGDSTLLKAFFSHNVIKTIPISQIVEGTDDNGYTPLHHAVGQPNSETVEALIQVGANINAKSPRGYTPLHILIQKEQYQHLPLLLKSSNCLVNELACDPETLQMQTPLDIFIDQKITMTNPNQSVLTVSVANNKKAIKTALSSPRKKSKFTRISTIETNKFSLGFPPIQRKIPSSISFFFLQKEYSHDIAKECAMCLRGLPLNKSRAHPLVKIWALEFRGDQELERNQIDEACLFYREGYVLSIKKNVESAYINGLIRTLGLLSSECLEPSERKVISQTTLQSIQDILDSKSSSDFRKEIASILKTATKITNPPESHPLSQCALIQFNHFTQPSQSSIPLYFILIDSNSNSLLRDYFLCIGKWLEIQAIIYGASSQTQQKISGPGFKIGRTIIWVTSLDEFSFWKDQMSIESPIMTELLSSTIVSGEEKIFSEFNKIMKNKPLKKSPIHRLMLASPRSLGKSKSSSKIPVEDQEEIELSQSQGHL